jgi:hypothetical protein
MQLSGSAEPVADAVPAAPVAAPPARRPVVETIDLAGDEEEDEPLSKRRAKVGRTGERTAGRSKAGAARASPLAAAKRDEPSDASKAMAPPSRVVLSLEKESKRYRIKKRSLPAGVASAAAGGNFGAESGAAESRGVEDFGDFDDLVEEVPAGETDASVCWQCGDTGQVMRCEGGCARDFHYRCAGINNQFQKEMLENMFHRGGQFECQQCRMGKATCSECHREVRARRPRLRRDHGYRSPTARAPMPHQQAGPVPPTRRPRVRHVRGGRVLLTTRTTG